MRYAGGMVEVQKITRKTAATLAVALITAVCAVMVAACGSSGSSSSGGSSAPSSGASSSGLSLAGLANTKPQPSAQHMGGTLHLISNEGWEHLDPATSYFQIDYLVVYATQT